MAFERSEVGCRNGKVDRWDMVWYNRVRGTVGLLKYTVDAEDEVFFILLC
jgi:hypothetical protein